jgi:Na+/H+-dicarboxylate symporter
MATERKKRFRFSLSTNIFIGLALGVLAGIFLGEYCADLKIVGDIFIQLLQMAVLPYIVVSLIAGLGRLTFSEAASLARKCGLVLLILWSLCITMVLVMPIAFPEWQSASFFSTSLVEEGKGFNFMELYVPANPFYSMTFNLVPAVVLFSIAVGVALIGVEKKEGLLENLSALVHALTSVTNYVIKLSPVGVFAIAASAAGTMNIEEFGSLQVYMVAYLVGWAVLFFWMLPVLVTSITPLSYRDVVWSARDAFVTAFATGNLLVVLAILAERSRELLKKCELSEHESASVEVIVPVSFNFPNVGKLFSLSFILFAGWFTDSTVSAAHYPMFVFSGFFSFFGAMAVAMPFMLDLLHIPADMFQLFLISDVLITRFGTLLAAMHTWVLALLGAVAMSGRFVIQWRKLLQYAVLSVLLAVVSMAGVRIFFAFALDPTYTKYESFVEMELMHDPVPSKVHDSLPPAPADGAKSALERIGKRGSMRVGYFKDSLPFAFTNAASNLVGFDVETLDFVLIEHEKIAERLNDGYCDIIMSGMAITPGRALEMTFSVSYMDQTAAFIVEDHRRDGFARWEDVRKLAAPRMGIPDNPYFISMAQNYLPQAKIVPLRSVRDFFRGKVENLDALIYSAEAGSAWTLVYPDYSVVVPRPDPLAVPLAYPVARGDHEMIDFINNWIELKKKDGTINKIKDHWILGRGAEKKEPRWSVIRNVFHWVE